MSYSVPFVDVFLGHEEDGGSTVRVWSVRHPRADIWPAVRRPFCGLYPFAPRNSSAVIAREYGSRAVHEKCYLQNYSHMKDKLRDGCTTNCDELHSRLPFVFRTRVTVNDGRNETHSGTMEELRVGSQVVQRYLALES